MASKIVPLDLLVSDVATGNLPQVAYVDPETDSRISEHPPGDVAVGTAWTVQTIRSIQASSTWGSTSILLTWDESGGFYDHVPPSQVDEWGYGFRVPMIVVSPFAKRGWIDHDVMDHTSIVKFIADNWGLAYLTNREARAGNLTNAFNFARLSAVLLQSALGTHGEQVSLGSGVQRWAQDRSPIAERPYVATDSKEE